MKAHHESTVVSRIAIWLFLGGIFTCTWDLLLTMDTGGFTLKVHQILFFLSLVLSASAHGRTVVRATLREMRAPFGILAALLGCYYLLSAPRSAFPVKSALYSCWILFNLGCVWINAQWIARKHGTGEMIFAVRATIAFLSAVILVDHIAYGLGYHHGLIGHNQGPVLNWNVSRPHAFSSEPSYVAAFLSLGFLTTTSLFSDENKWLPRLLDLLVVSAVFFTTSRAGLIALAGGILLLVALQGIRKMRFPIKPFAFLSAAAFICIALFMATTSTEHIRNAKAALLETLLKGKDGSANSRLQGHFDAIQVARDTDWLGSGLGASYKFISEHYPEKTIPALPAPFSQNDYGKEAIMSIWGQLVAEGGIPALVLFAGMAVVLLTGLFRQLKSRPLVEGPFAASIIFFCFLAFCLGNVARGDIWIWYALWSAVTVGGLIERPNATT